MSDGSFYIFVSSDYQIIFVYIQKCKYTFLILCFYQILYSVHIDMFAYINRFLLFYFYTSIKLNIWTSLVLIVSVARLFSSYYYMYNFMSFITRPSFYLYLLFSLILDCIYKGVYVMYLWRGQPG